MDYFKFIILENRKLVVYKTSEILLLSNDNKKWRCSKQSNTSTGYKSIYFNNKNFRVHRIIAYAFLGLDIEDKTQYIDHIDGNRENNNLENLRIVNSQTNCFNKKDVKGYRKQCQKFQARIKKDGKEITIGTYDTSEEARQAYLDAKSVYHKMEL